MPTPELPRPDRWLVYPDSLHAELASLACAVGGLMQLRFDSGHVEAVAANSIHGRMAQLLAADWGTVRLVAALGDAVSTAAFAAALNESTAALDDSARARIRLHDHESDPEGSWASLNAPDEAILARWLESGAQGAPELAGRELEPGWIAAYRSAFARWQRSVIFHQGAEAFDWFFDAPAPGLETPAPAGAVAIAPTWMRLAANEAPGAAPWALAAQSGGGEAGGQLLGRWTQAVLGHALRLELRSQSLETAQVFVEVEAPAPLRRSIRLLELRLRSGQGGEVIAATALAWSDYEHDGTAYAWGTFDNADGLLPQRLRAGALAAELGYELIALR